MGHRVCAPNGSKVFEENKANGMTRSDFHLELVTVRLLKKKKKKRIIESQYKNLIFPQKCRKAEPLSIGTQHGMPQRNDMQTFIW